MTTADTAERLNRLSELLERAREDARADATELGALLDEASSTLASLPSATTGQGDGGVAVALRRAHASYVTLQQTLREELARIGQQLAHVSAGTEAAARYAPSRSTTRQFDRVG